MTTLILGGLLLLLIPFNVPIAFAMATASIVALLYRADIPLTLITHRMIYGTDSFVMLAVPLFILAGSLMDIGGISFRLLKLARALVGHFRGGLPMAVVVSEMLFSGISGSTVADVSALASMDIPAMRRAGYTGQYAVAIVSASSAMGILIPPCIMMVIFGAIANVSVTALFLAGFLPAFTLAGFLFLLIAWQARRPGEPHERRATWRELLAALGDAGIALGMPIIIFGGILGGAFTPTEAAAVAVLYAFVAGVFVYRQISWSQLWRLIVESCATTGIVMLLIGFSNIYSYLLAIERLPDQVARLILSVSTSPWFLLFAVSMLVLFLSVVIEALPAGVICIPIFLPVVDKLGIDRLHFLILMVTAGGIGMFVPPSGVGLIVGCSVARVGMAKVVSPLMPFLAVLVVGLLVLITFPTITTVVPHLVRR